MMPDPMCRMRFGMAAILILLSAACEKPQTVNPSAAPRLSTDTVILLPPPDVQLSELTVSGVEEPRADWTETGRRNLIRALDAENQRRGVGFVKIDYAGLTPEEQVEIGQIEKLHQAVAVSMLAHRHVPALRLPTKTSVYAWSMGPEVGLLRKANSGQGKYALFVTVHDSFSSAGRVAMQVIMGALTGYVPHGGTQVGYASLVDLDTGKVAWFGSVAKGTGDVRDATGAALPKFSSGMDGLELQEFIGATVSRALAGGVSARMLSLNPVTFMGEPGFETEFAHPSRDGLDMRGFAEGAVIGGKLYMVMFFAPRIHYFGKDIGEVRQIANSARKA